MTSKLTVNIVVGLLGLALLTCLGGAIVLSFTDHSIPEQLWNTASVALGALAAVLVSTRVPSELPPPPPVTKEVV